MSVLLGGGVSPSRTTLKRSLAGGGDLGCSAHRVTRQPARLELLAAGAHFSVTNLTASWRLRSAGLASLPPVPYRVY